MSDRIARFHRLNHLGLVMMSAAAGAFLLCGPGYGYLLTAMAISGASLALGGRIQARRLERRYNQADPTPGMGGYPLDIMRRAGLTDR